MKGKDEFYTVRGYKMINSRKKTINFQYGRLFRNDLSNM